MADTTFTFRVEESLKTAFAEAARVNDLTAAQVLRAAMRDYVARGRKPADDGCWLAARVRLAEASIAQGLGIPHDVLAARFASIRADARLAQ